MEIGLIVALVTALAGPLLAYLAAARKLSGRITTSAASELWDEAKNLRIEYKEEAKFLRAEIQACNKRIEEIEAHNAELHRENGNLRKIIAKLERKIDLLEEENELLRTEVARLKKDAL